MADGKSFTNKLIVTILLAGISLGIMLTVIVGGSVTKNAEERKEKQNELTNEFNDNLNLVEDNPSVENVQSTIKMLTTADKEFREVQLNFINPNLTNLQHIFEAYILGEAKRIEKLEKSGKTKEAENSKSELKKNIQITYIRFHIPLNNIN